MQYGNVKCKEQCHGNTVYMQYGTIKRKELWEDGRLIKAITYDDEGKEIKCEGDCD